MSPHVGPSPSPRLWATALRNLADMIERGEAKVTNMEVAFNELSHPRPGAVTTDDRIIEGAWQESTLGLLHRHAWWEWAADNALPEPRSCCEAMDVDGRFHSEDCAERAGPSPLLRRISGADNMPEKGEGT